MGLEFYINQWIGIRIPFFGSIRGATVCLWCIVIAAMCTLSGCAKVDLIDFWRVKGHLIIEPDCGIHTLPALKYHFYNTPRYGTKDESFFVSSLCDGAGNYSGNLPMGTYRTIAVCTNAEHTTLENMDYCDLATVNIPPITTDTRSGETLYPQPGDVYAVMLDSYILEPGDTLRHTPEPFLLTKRIQLTLSMNRELSESIINIRGVLRGVSPGVSFFPCVAAYPDPKDAHTMATEFTASPWEGSRWGSQIKVFDICNPKYGSAYTNFLSLSIYSETEGLEYLDVNISDVLSDAIADNKGTLPLVVPIEIKVLRTYIGLECGVTPWEESGNSENIIPRI